MRTRQRVRDPPQRQRLRREDLPDASRRVLVELPERRGVERARGDAGCAKRVEPPTQLAGRLVREGDRKDLVRTERARRHLARDPVRDRRRLAGARAREDADGAAHRLDGAPLLGIQLHGRQPRPPGRTDLER